MSALTMTLLPEPVAPAISRCGILARSTAWATPATSRPRANVSFDSDAVKSTSSRMRRSGDDVEVLVRDLDADRALAGDRRLDPERVGRRAPSPGRRTGASIRLSLTSGAGWTSYWVTTGPALRPTIRAGMPKLASFLTMISSFRTWTASSPPAWSGTAMSSSVVERRQRRTRCGPWSAANRWRRSRRRDRAAGRTGATSVAEAAPRPAGRRERVEVWPLLGTAAGIAVLVVAPDAGLAGRRRRARPARRLPLVAARPLVRPPARPRRPRPYRPSSGGRPPHRRRGRGARPSERSRPPAASAAGAGSRSRR